MILLFVSKPRTHFLEMSHFFENIWDGRCQNCPFIWSTLKQQNTSRPVCGNRSQLVLTELNSMSAEILSQSGLQQDRRPIRKSDGRVWIRSNRSNRKRTLWVLYPEFSPKFTHIVWPSNLQWSMSMMMIIYTVIENHQIRIQHTFLCTFNISGLAY